MKATERDVESTAREVEPTQREVEATVREVEPTQREVMPTHRKVEPRVLLRWRDHPAARRPRAAIVAGLVIIAFAAAVGLAFGSAVWAGVSIIVLFISLNRFFLPSAYAIDEHGLTAKFPFTTRRIEWKAVRRIKVTRYDLLLAANRRRTWINARRESRVPFGDQKQRVLELVREYVGDDVRERDWPQRGTEGAEEGAEGTMD